MHAFEIVMVFGVQGFLNLWASDSTCSLRKARVADPSWYDGYDVDGARTAMPRLQPQKRQVRILGGDATSGFKHKYMGLLYIGWYELCGVAIVANNWCITAASCFEYSDDVSEYRVRTSSYGGVSSTTYYHNVIRNYKHPRYNQTSNDYNIAVLKIQPPVINQQNFIVRMEDNRNVKRDMCSILGYGKFNQSSRPTHLLEAIMKPIKLDKCRAIYARLVTTAPHFMPRSIGESNFCLVPRSSATNETMCGEDSGGPVLCHHKLHGVIGAETSDFLCGEIVAPVAVIDTVIVHSWIHDTISEVHNKMPHIKYELDTGSSPMSIYMAHLICFIYMLVFLCAL